jgi:hypothetical protein
MSLSSRYKSSRSVQSRSSGLGLSMALITARHPTDLLPAVSPCGRPAPARSASKSDHSTTATTPNCLRQPRVCHRFGQPVTDRAVTEAYTLPLRSQSTASATGDRRRGRMVASCSAMFGEVSAMSACYRFAKSDRPSATIDGFTVRARGLSSFNDT